MWREAKVYEADGQTSSQSDALGCFTASGVGRIPCLEAHETCNIEWYLEVLDHQIISSARAIDWK